MLSLSIWAFCIVSVIGCGIWLYKQGKDAEKLDQAEEVIDDVKKSKRIADRSGRYFDDFIMRKRDK